MIFGSIKFQNHRCFKKEWAGFERIKPLNVIIGRNNSGKSHLLELVQALCSDEFTSKGWKIWAAGELQEGDLKKTFPHDLSEGVLGGNFWHNHGRLFVGLPVQGVLVGGRNVEELKLPETNSIWLGLSPHQQNDARKEARLERLRGAFATGHSIIKGKRFCRIAAERNITPEVANTELELRPDGRGATNIIRRHLNSSNPKYPRDLIQEKLRTALNEIFGPDGRFTEVETNHHDEPTDPDQPKDTWEIYLTEEKKGRVALSRSGSGLKTVILVLLELLVLPELDHTTKSSYVYAFEELENNLHPALLRRLLRFIECYVKKHEATVFLTTHSSVALDVFGMNDDAQIVHVVHDGESASTRTISAHFERTGIVAELGAKPSDLLQANGVVWVEGPSDRIYLNRWIELASEGKFKEGRDYACAFYGGALLANDQFTSPEEADPNFSNLLRVNGNIVVVCDSDRTAESGQGAELKPRVLRVKAEVSKIPNAVLWITETKEIENYLPVEVVQKVFEKDKIDAPKSRERFFPSPTGAAKSYLEDSIGRKTFDKVELATLAAREMTLEKMSSRFDWKSAMAEIVSNIDAWNQ